MGQPVYNTKQREAILAFLASLEGSHVTAAQIADHVRAKGRSVGLTTIYRHLDRLAEAGMVKKYVLEGEAAACYQAVEDSGCREHFHLKCEGCGCLIHLQCDQLAHLADHFRRDHGFSINPGKTVFYGTCDKCGGNP